MCEVEFDLVLVLFGGAVLEEVLYLLVDVSDVDVPEDFGMC